MMANLLAFIKSSRELLRECLELCDSLESSVLSNDFTDEMKEKKLNKMNKRCSKLKSVITGARKIKVEGKIITECKQQNGDHLDEMINVYKKESKLKVVEAETCNETVHNDMDVDELNKAAKEAILNDSDSDDAIDSVLQDTECAPPIKKCYIKIQGNNVYETVNKDVVNHDLTNENIADKDDKLTIIENIFNRIAHEDIVLDNPDKVVKNGSGSETELHDKPFISVEKKFEVNAKNMSEDTVGDNLSEYIANGSTVEISDEEAYAIKECSVLLEDLSNLDPKHNYYKNYVQALEAEVNKLGQIPKFPNKIVKKLDITDKKKLNKERPVKKSSIIFQSDSDNDNSDSDSVKSKSRSIDLDITETVMIDEPMSSTDSKASSKSSEIEFKSHKSKKYSHAGNGMQRRITRSLKIPIMSDSETSQKTALSNGKATKKQTKKVVCLSSTSDDESDASASDLRKGGKRKKPIMSKSRSKKQKLDSDQEEKDKSDDGGTRKHIHKIITKSKLSEATKAAELLEAERRKRMDEKQEMYNNSMLNRDTSKMDGKEELILEKDDKGDVIVAVHKYISDQLKVHQIEAVHFMYDCVIESVDCLLKSQKDKEADDKSSSAVGGCILAHCMGLGKTLSLIAFMHTMLTTPVLNLYSCIVICPANTAINWKKEWEMWMPKDRPVKLFEVCSAENKQFKMSIVKEWSVKGGVLIIGYEMFRLLASDDRRYLRNKNAREKMRQVLLDPGADFVVCDEGHLLKNEKSAINKVVNQMKTKRRIVLTGTPLQNRLPEYHTMVSFVKPSLLGTHKEFLNRFVNPISNGQHINSTPYDVKIMKKRSHILFKTLDGCVHRRDYSALVKYLPPKYEYVIMIRLTDIQMQLYRAYLAETRTEKRGLFTDQKALARIMTHPFVICMHQEIQDKKSFMVDSGDESFLDDSSDDSDTKHKTKKETKKPLEENNLISLMSDDDANTGAGDDKKDSNHKMEAENGDKSGGNESGSVSSHEEVVRNWKTTTRSGRRNKMNDSDEEEPAGVTFELESLKEPEPDKHWWSELIKPEHEHQVEISSKLVILFQILRKANDIGDKVILFSQSLLVLDIVEKYLYELHVLAEKVSLDLEKLNESVTDQKDTTPTLTDEHKAPEFLSDIGYNTWVKGVDYDRMDGSTQIVTRSDIMTRFNVESDRRLRLFLISTKAGGMGVNLVAANRVVIFDVSWNPSHDIQAIFRSYRFGQNKPVYVYRLVSQATIEEKMYERQVTKQSLSLRVVDEQQISRYFTEEDLKSLYKFEPDIYDPDKERETPILPKDRFLAELIQEFPQYIYSYHEHDSLLQNKDEEELTELERQEAWKEFEDEKVHGTRPVINQMPMSIDPTMFAQSQMNMMLQQYPQYAALFGQNYMNLLRYVLMQQPELKYNAVGLSARIQTVFFLSLQKYKTDNPSVNIAASRTAAATTEGTSEGNNATDPVVLD